MVMHNRLTRWGTQHDGWRADGFRLALVVYPPGLRMPPHEDAESHVTLVVAGGVEEQAGCESWACRPGTVLLKPAGIRHENRVGSAGLLTLAVFCDTVDVPSRESWKAALCGYRAIQRREIGVGLFRVLVAMGDGGAADDECAADIWDVLARLDRSVEAEAARPCPAWLRKVRDAVQDRAAGPLRVAELAAEAGVHPVYLARAFRRGFACSIREYIHRERAQRAASLLAAGNAGLADVAVAAGFADQAHLCRRFKQHLGVSPGAYRRLTRRRLVSFVQDGRR